MSVASAPSDWQSELQSTDFVLLVDAGDELVEIGERLFGCLCLLSHSSPFLVQVRCPFYHKRETMENSRWLPQVSRQMSLDETAFSSLTQSVQSALSWLCRPGRSLEAHPWHRDIHRPCNAKSDRTMSMEMRPWGPRVSSSRAEVVARG